MDELTNQVQAAKTQVSDPAQRLAVRDALLVSAASTRDHAETPRDEASALSEFVDGLMTRRDAEVVATLKRIEEWAAERAATEGYRVTAGVVALAAVLLHRFGATMEIPMSELEEALDVFGTIRARVSEDRRTVTFMLSHKDEKAGAA